MCEIIDLSELFEPINDDHLISVEGAVNASKFQKEALKKQLHLSNFVDETTINTIKSTISYKIIDYLFDDAKKWCEKCFMDCTEISGYFRQTEKDVFSSAYSTLTKLLKDLFTTNKLEIFDMYYEGSSHCIRHIEFVTDIDYYFILTIPRIDKLDKENIEKLNYGKIGLGYFIKPCCPNMTYTYNAKDLKQIMNDILTLPKDTEHLSVPSMEDNENEETKYKNESTSATLYKEAKELLEEVLISCAPSAKFDCDVHKKCSECDNLCIDCNSYTEWELGDKIKKFLKRGE